MKRTASDDGQGNQQQNNQQQPGMQPPKAAAKAEVENLRAEAADEVESVRSEIEDLRAEIEDLRSALSGAGVSEERVDKIESAVGVLDDRVMGLLEKASHRAIGKGFDADRPKARDAVGLTENGDGDE